MFNLIWVYPHLMISNVNELNLFYNATNLSVFFKSLFLLYLSIAFLVLSKLNFSVLILFTFFFKQHVFEIVKLSTVNNGLINPLAFWHPVNLAMLFTLLLFSVVVHFNNYRLFIVVTVFVFSGSWWSSQEVLWHGWWNWDGVENTLLNLTLYLFFLSHKRLNSMQKAYFFKFILLFIYLYFFVLNKTNVFKSIHSFTTSIHSNLSYNNFIYLHVYFILFLYYFKKFKIFLVYNLFLTVPFYFSMYVYNSVVFSKMDFFLHLNFYFFFVIYVSRFGFFILLINIFFNTFYISTIIVILIYFTFWKLKKHQYIHNFYLFCFIALLNVIFKQNFIFFDYCFCNDRFLYNFSICNKMLIGSDLMFHYLLHNLSFNVSTVFKNLNVTKTSLFQDYLWVSYWNVTNFYKFFSLLILFLFLVTKVFYSKQKPRYNYYM